MSKATVDPRVCKGCGLCVRTCPVKIITLEKTSLNEKGYYPARVFDPDRCIGCGMCALICPDCAITVKK